MTEIATEVWPIASSEDVVRFRQAVKRIAGAVGFGVVDQTKIVTAASEIARNALDYGGGGTGTIEVFDRMGRQAVRAVISDNGPGISDLQRAMTDGFTSGGGMGLGLGGAKRLVNEFDIVSRSGEGTTVTITRWR